MKKHVRWRQLALNGFAVTREQMKDRAVRMAAVRIRRNALGRITPAFLLYRRRARSCAFCVQHGYASCAAPNFCFSSKP